MGMLPPGCIEACPGCTHRSLSAPESENKKLQFLRSTLARWSGKVQAVRALPDGRRLGYRERACLRAQWKGDRWAFGFQDRLGRSVIEIPDCPVHSPRIRFLLRGLAAELPSPQELPLLYVVISGRFLTCVVKSAPFEFLPSSKLLEMLSDAEVEGFFLNFHPSAGNRVFSSRGWRHLRGKQTAFTNEGLKYGPQSFHQLVPELYSRALTAAEDFLNPSARTAVLDLYSGTGASLVRWVQRGSRALGVELGGEAARLAAQNCSAADILRGRCGDRIPQIRAWGKSLSRSTEILAFCNPPRTGLEPQVSGFLVSELKPGRIAYLSCSAGTLTRDLEIFEKGRYRVKALIPWDFFPQTHHVEILAFLGTSSE